MEWDVRSRRLRNEGFPPRVIYINIDGQMVFHLLSDIRQANHPCIVCCPKRKRCPNRLSAHRPCYSPAFPRKRPITAAAKDQKGQRSVNRLPYARNQMPLSSNPSRCAVSSCGYALTSPTPRKHQMPSTIKVVHPIPCPSSPSVPSVAWSSKRPRKQVSSPLCRK